MELKQAAVEPVKLECSSCESFPDDLEPQDLSIINNNLENTDAKGLDSIDNHFNLFKSMQPSADLQNEGIANDDENPEFSGLMNPEKVRPSAPVASRRKIQKMCNIIYLLGFLDLFAVSMVITMLPLHIKAVTGEVTMAGILGSLYGCIQIFSGPLIGSLSDKQGRKLALLICLIPTCLSYLILSLSDPSEDSSVLYLLIGRTLGGVFKHSQTICRTYLADMVPPEQKARVFGRFNAYSSLGFVFGPITGGYFLEKSEDGFQVICQLAAAVFLLMFALAYYYLLEILPDKDFLSRFGKKRAEALLKNVSWNHKQFYKIQLLRFLLSLSSLIFRFTFTFQLQNVYKLPAQNIGIIIAFQGLLSVLTGFFTGHLYRVYGDVFLEFLHVTIIYTISLTLLAFLPPFEALIALQIPLTVSASFLRVIFAHMITLTCPSEHLGNALGIGATIIAISRSIAPLLSTGLYNTGTYTPGVAATISAALGLLCGWRMFFKEDAKVYVGKVKLD